MVENKCFQLPNWKFPFPQTFLGTSLSWIAMLLSHGKNKQVLGRSSQHTYGNPYMIWGLSLIKHQVSSSAATCPPGLELLRFSSNNPQMGAIIPQFKHTLVLQNVVTTGVVAEHILYRVKLVAPSVERPHPQVQVWINNFSNQKPASTTTDASLDLYIRGSGFSWIKNACDASDNFSDHTPALSSVKRDWKLISSGIHKHETKEKREEMWGQSWSVLGLFSLIFFFNLVIRGK